MSGYRPEFILISGYRFFDHLGFVTDRDQTPPPTARARQTPDSDRKQQNELRSKIANPVSSPPPGMYVRATYIEREALRGLENTTPSLFSPSKLKVRTLKMRPSPSSHAPSNEKRRMRLKPYSNPANNFSTLDPRQRVQDIHVGNLRAIDSRPPPARLPSSHWACRRSAVGVRLHRQPNGSQ